MGYRPALDGLRAVSVVTIMLFHVPVSWVQGGYWSVNVFFVVSGYLITGLLLKEYAKWGNIDLVGFYLRRARRLLPALLVMLVVVALVTPRIMDNQTPGTIKGDGIAALFYVANWRMIITGQSYFEQFGSPSPFRHTWTLGIEEQYYLIFPLLLIVLLHVFTRRRSWGPTIVVGALALASAVVMAMVNTPGDPSRVYYGTDARMQDILVGAVLALVLHRMGARRVAALSRHRRPLELIGWTAAVATIVWFLWIPADGWVFNGGFLLFDVMFVLLVLSVELAPTTSIARVLSTPVVVWVGKLSYGLYLWHWPLFVLLTPERTGLDTVPLTVVRFAATFAVSAASYYWIEDPIRRGSLRRRLGPRVSPAFSTAAVGVAAVLIGVSATGVQLAPSARAGEAQAATVGSGDYGVLIVGDSVGFSLGYNFPKEKFPGVAATARVNFGCGTAEQHLAFNGKPQKGEDQEECNTIFANWRDGMQQTKPKAIVWSLGGWEVFDHEVDGKVLEVGSPAYAAYLTARLEEGLKALSPSTAPVFITNVPCYHQEKFVVAGQDLSSDRNDPQRGKAVNAVLDAFAAKHPDRVHIADLDSFACPNGKYEEVVRGKKIRIDGVHYSADGARGFWEWLMPQIKKVTG
ncbi:hypothetical protein VV01_09085 [Luteipulveratus halotolerans]|uniref:Acyltransferase 3 domain-containing protein n=2 Tax=Luteipulveratus halotolerans TaxID=1631356 RepID=A0A0L6CIC3_9MICO|nr:hypothetical protein VV01_09085 [Luteipulveratus halotolerans]